MYKDKDKQREANRKAQAKFKAKGITSEGITDRVLPDIRLLEPMSVGQPKTITKADNHIGASDIGVVKALHQAINKPKRGKDIKCFADLPPDVQSTINRISVDEAEHKRRTAIAINYQTSLSRHRLDGLSSGVA